MNNSCYGQIIFPQCGQFLLWSDHFLHCGQFLLWSDHFLHCGQVLLWPAQFLPLMRLVSVLMHSSQAHGFIDPLKKILVGASLTLLHLTSLDKPCFSYSPDTLSLTLGSQETRLQKPPAIFQETCGSAIVAIAADSS